MVEAYISGQDVLMISPTGSGKSLTFHIAPFAIDFFKHGKGEGVAKTQTPKTQTSDPENSDPEKSDPVKSDPENSDPLKFNLFSILFT